MEESLGGENVMEVGINCNFVIVNRSVFVLRDDVMDFFMCRNYFMLYLLYL